MDISVVVPCHNGQPYLSQAIRSVLDQARPPNEVIVIDDSSTDDSAAVARSFGHAVRVESKRFRNAAKARNFGASLARGDAVMFLDADDVLAPDVLQVLGNEIEVHRGSIAACPWFRLELKDGRWIRRPASCSPRRPGQDPLDAWLRGWYHPPCSVLWCRRAYERIGGWDPRVKVNQDGDLMMRALARETPLRLTSGGEAFYRRSPSGRHSVSGARLSEEGLRSRIYVLLKITRLLEEDGRLDRYRPAIGHALSQVMWDAGDAFPQIANACRLHRRTFGEPEWKRVARSILRQVGRALPGSRRSAGPGEPIPPAEGGEPVEVRYGLEDPS